MISLTLARRLYSVHLSLAAQCAAVVPPEPIAHDYETNRKPALIVDSPGCYLTAVKRDLADDPAIETPHVVLDARETKLTAEDYRRLRVYLDACFPEVVTAVDSRVLAEYVDLNDDLKSVLVAHDAAVEAKEEKAKRARAEMKRELELAFKPYDPDAPGEQLRLPFNGKGEKKPKADRDADLAMADAVESGEVIEDDPPVLPLGDLSDLGDAVKPPSVDAITSINGALKAAGVIKPPSKRSGRNRNSIAESLGAIDIDQAAAEMAELEAL